MTKKLTEKYNNSCIKLFSFIKMLYEDSADFHKVINLLSDNNYDGTSNTHVMLNKYLNALKIFGLRVKKVKKKYKMYSSLVKLDFSPSDLKSISILKKALDILPEGSEKKNLNAFIENIKLMMNDSIHNIEENPHYSKNFEFFNSNAIDQIKLCEKYCQDKQKLEIVYIAENGEEINLLCSPIETAYIKHKTYLKTMGNNGSRVYKIPLENIKSIIQLPSSANPMSLPTTVIYRIKNRLAKNYKLRDWERLESIESDGSQVIVNKNEDLNILIRRLMKYGTECKIISPKFMKEEIINLINKTLSNYQ